MYALILAILLPLVLYICTLAFLPRLRENEIFTLSRNGLGITFIDAFSDCSGLKAHTVLYPEEGKLDINITTVQQVTVVALAGDIDGKTAPQAQEHILPLVEPGGKILLDMSGVVFMSSAGLRMLLATYRQVTGNRGQIALAGLSPEIEDIMSATGFLRFFTTYETVEAGLAALQ